MALKTHTNSQTKPQLCLQTMTYMFLAKGHDNMAAGSLSLCFAGVSLCNAFRALVKQPANKSQCKPDISEYTLHMK